MMNVGVTGAAMMGVGVTDIREIGIGVKGNAMWPPGARDIKEKSLTHPFFHARDDSGHSPLDKTSGDGSGGAFMDHAMCHAFDHPVDRTCARRMPEFVSQPSAG